jgi:hypothetical protein
MPRKSTTKISPLNFIPVGDYLPGAISLDASIPLAVRKARLELWQEWHRYNRIKLAAALDGDISSERDAKVQSIYARRGNESASKLRQAKNELSEINFKLRKYHKVILNHAKVDKALALLSACEPTKPKVKKAKPQSYKARLAEARKLARKGFSTSFNALNVWIMITPDNYKQPVSKLVDKRLAEIAAHEAKYANLGKCQCAIHKDLTASE